MIKNVQATSIDVRHRGIVRVWQAGPDKLWQWQAYSGMGRPMSKTADNGFKYWQDAVKQANTALAVKLLDKETDVTQAVAPWKVFVYRPGTKPEQKTRQLRQQKEDIEAIRWIY